MDLMWLMIGFFLFITMLFVVIAFLFPEWVGITGKKALDVHKHQAKDQVATAIVPGEPPKSN